MQRALTFIALLPIILMMGCAYALPVASCPTDVKLRVAAAEPPSAYHVPTDGRVSFAVPSFRHGCSIYLFGAIKIVDNTPERLQVIEVCCGEQVLRRFSLTQLTHLPKDEAGYRIIRVGE
jgi:hypothetical protein